MTLNELLIFLSLCLAFPIESKLPDISQYDKIRLYGHTFDFQNKDVSSSLSYSVLIYF